MFEHNGVAVYSGTEETASGAYDSIGYAERNEYAVAAYEEAAPDGLEEGDEETEVERALAQAYHDAVQTGESPAEGYLAALAEQEAPTRDTPMVHEEETEYVELYTTAQVGDVPGTVVVDSHRGDYNNRAVRLVRCGAGDVEAQLAQYRSQGRMVRTAEQWAVLQAKVADGFLEMPVPVPARAQSVALTTDRLAVLPDVPAQEGEETTGAAPEIPQAVLEAEALAQAAKDAQAQLKAMHEQMKILAEQSKVLQAQAHAAKAAAPVVITAELRVKLDTLNRIVAGGEQAIAKAITNGVLFVRMPGGAKADTGRIRKVAERPRSNGVVDIHHIGEGATVVNASNHTMSQEKRDAIRAIRAAIAGIPKELVSDSLVAKKLDLESKLGLNPKQAKTLVWHVKQEGSYPDVV